MALVAEYALDESSGLTAADTSGNGHTLTVAGTFTTGHTNNGLTASGSTIGGKFTVTGPTGACTIEAWVKPSSLPGGGTQAVVGLFDGVGNSEFVIWAQRGDFGTSNVVQGNVRTSGLNELTGSALSVGTWAHVAMTYDGTNAVLYINGTSVDSSAIGGALHSSEQFCCCGAPTVNSNLVVDDVRFYDTALSGAQVVTDMNTPAGGSAPPETTTGDPLTIEASFGTPAAAAHRQGAPGDLASTVEFGTPDVAVHRQGTPADFATTVEFGTPTTTAHRTGTATAAAAEVTFNTPTVGVHYSTTAQPLALTAALQQPLEARHQTTTAGPFAVAADYGTPTSGGAAQTTAGPLGVTVAFGTPVVAGNAATARPLAVTAAFATPTAVRHQTAAAEPLRVLLGLGATAGARYRTTTPGLSVAVKFGPIPGDHRDISVTVEMEPPRFTVSIEDDPLSMEAG